MLDYNNLDYKTKEHIKIAFNLASQSQIENDDEKLLLSFIASFLFFDDDINIIYSKYKKIDVKYKLGIFDNIKEFETLNIKDNIIEKTSFYQNNPNLVKKQVNNFIEYIEYIKTSYPIFSTNIKPFLLFDFFLYYYKCKLNDKIKDKNVLQSIKQIKTTQLVDDFFNELDNYIDNKFISCEKELNRRREEMAEEFNNNELKLTFNDTIFYYKDGKFYLKFNNDNNNKISIDNDNKETFISMPMESEILSINDTSPSFQEILNTLRDIYFNCDIIKLKLKDLKTNNTQTYKLKTSSLLDERPISLLKKDKDDNAVLNKYCKDLTSNNYSKDPSISRDDELRRVYQVLLYPEKDKSIIIVGESGVGKTALVQGLAYRIQKQLVPNQLKDLRIYSLSIPTLVAGTKYRGTLEEKIQEILSEVSKDKNIILFIDEIHQAIGAGTTDKDNTSVAEILKPYIDYGDIRIIGSTTEDEYNEYLSTDQAFKTRFKEIQIKEPNDLALYIILEDLIYKYNEISYSKINEKYIHSIVTWLIKATNKKYRKYNDGINNPRLMLDIIKEAYAIATLDNSQEVTLLHIEQAYLNEDRLYKSSKEEFIQKLNSIMPNDTKNNIIKFIIKK